MSRYYDRQGNPMEFMDWARAFKDNSVALARLPNGYRVSTVYLGLNHQYGDGPPLIFESMVFGGNTNDEQDCERYSTEAEALAGHAAMVKKWKPIAERAK